MDKKEAVVDTCFLLKLSAGGKKIDYIKLLLNELEYVPVIHPYIYNYEILNDGIKRLIDEGYIRKIDYNEFLTTEFEKQLYCDYFEQIYEIMRKRQKAVNSPKTPKKLELKGKQTIYNVRCAGSSIGDVHMILMASFMGLPIILTEDNDIEVLRSIADKQMSFSKISIEILCASDLIINLAQKDTCSLSKNELETILSEIGERKKRTLFREAWNSSH